MSYRPRITFLQVVIIMLMMLSVSTACSKMVNDTSTEVDYVTLTYSRNVTDDINSPIVNEFLYYDNVTQEISKVFETEYTSQYPLGFYDKKNNLIYYTKNANLSTENDLSGDQIFVTNLNDGTETQLTDDLFAVNYIYALDHQVFFVARPISSKVLKLGLLDKSTGKISYWGDENTIEDINIEAMTVDNKNKRIYISAYSNSERRYNVMHQDGPAGQNNFKMPLHTVYETDFSFEHTRILLSEHEWIRTLMTKNNFVIALSDQQYNDAATPSSLIQYDLLNDSMTKQIWDTHRLQVGDANYSSDGTKIYTITIVNNKRGLYEYDLETKQFKELFTPQDGFVNNIQVVKGGNSTESTKPTAYEIEEQKASGGDCPPTTEHLAKKSSDTTTNMDDFMESIKHEIPKQMEPSTILKYGENNELIITKDPTAKNSNPVVTSTPAADSVQQELREKEEALMAEIKEEAKCLPVIDLGYDLPKPEPGLVVLYGTDGYINRYYYENEVEESND